jgi:hypothetical protein
MPLIYQAFVIFLDYVLHRIFKILFHPAVFKSLSPVRDEIFVENAKEKTD